MPVFWIIMVLIENIITLVSFNDYCIFNYFSELPLNGFSIEINSEDFPIKKNNDYLDCYKTTLECNNNNCQKKRFRFFIKPNQHLIVGLVIIIIIIIF